MLKNKDYLCHLYVIDDLKLIPLFSLLRCINLTLWQSDIISFPLRSDFDTSYRWPNHLIEIEIFINRDTFFVIIKKSLIFWVKYDNRTFGSITH